PPCPPPREAMCPATSIARIGSIGVEVPRFYGGQQIGTVRRPDYRLAMKVLDHHLANLNSGHR
ncbi:MAG: hypothetical protein JWN21_1904, partial [Sphingomonas bacterium]|uniref:hypothetical protein n=1 Tax=Sphingomonas bacterium TaxID=1895847 RepID=UPI002638129B